MIKRNYLNNFAANKNKMNRRTILKLGLLSGSVSSAPILMNFNSENQKKKETKNNGYIKIKLEPLEILIFSDGHLSLENPHPIFAPEVNSSDFNRELENLYFEKNNLGLALNVMVIKQGEKIILIDAGSGNHFGPNEGWLHENIEKAGISANAVTDIFITHAHPDHIGGLVTKNGTLVYPKAQYHMAKTEFNFWMSDNPDCSKSKISTELKETLIIFAKKILTSIKEKIKFFDHGDILFSCLHTELAEGHTPGHTAFTISSGSKSIKHIVDTIHTPLLIKKPEWGTQWDVDFEKGIETRIRILEDGFINRQLLMTSHLPWPGLGYIRKAKEYDWIPLPYFTPNEIYL